MPWHEKDGKIPMPGLQRVYHCIAGYSEEKAREFAARHGVEIVVLERDGKEIGATKGSATKIGVYVYGGYIARVFIY